MAGTALPENTTPENDMSNANEPVQAGTKLQAIVGPDGREYFHPISTGGMTKREYFAAMAMQGILANHQYEPPRRNKIAMMAVDAVWAADALLAELERTS